jgi:hypothetical protein
LNNDGNCKKFLVHFYHVCIIEKIENAVNSKQKSEKGRLKVKRAEKREEIHFPVP